MRILSMFVLAALLLSSGKEGETDGKVPHGLMCELLSRPDLSVITNPRPGFSWIVPSTASQDFQTAYQIMVAGTLPDMLQQRNMVWDSGKVPSSESSHVAYDGSPLLPLSSYWWKVRTWNASGEASGWSSPQKFNTGELYREKKWPGESRWVRVELPRGESIWTFENRHPIEYHETDAVRTSSSGHSLFFDFGRSAFACPKIEYTLESSGKSKSADTLWVLLGEKAVGDSIDQLPGGGVLFRKYPFPLKSGHHTETLELPRFVPRYPHSQAMPDHMPEVIPFRFIEIQADIPGLKINRVIQNGLYYHFDEHASYFSCSDQRLNDIYDLCRYSVKVNTFNGDYAASQRERMMYEADCYIHQMCHYAVDREYAIARYSLENMIFHATWPTEWILHTILMAWADYMHTGDTTIPEKYFNELEAKLMLGLASENYLISTRTGKQTPEFLQSIHFNGKELRDIVDWPHGGMGLVETNGETDNFDFTDYNAVVNAFHYRALVLMSEMAAAVGRNEKAERFAERAVLVRKSFTEAFYNSEKGVYVDGIGSEHASIHSNMYALAFGLVDEPHKPGVIAYVKYKGMACGVYGANYLMEALFNERETKHAFSLLTSDGERSWLNMLRVGSTMTTEAWDNRYKSNNGWSHAWSASPAHIIPRKIMGVEPLQPGFKEILIAPRPAELSFANCKVPTIRGPVKVEFKQAPGRYFTIRFEIPAGTRAKFIIPEGYAQGEIFLNGFKATPELSDGEYFLYTDANINQIQISKP